MSKASQSIALFLVPLSLIFLGFHSCDDGDDGTWSGGSSGHSTYYGHSSFFGGSSHSSGSSFSGTSRGGFGSHGGSIGS